MQNSSSLTELLSRLLRVIRQRSGAVRSRHFCERLLERTGSSAPDDVGTPLAELISEPNHFLCCGSAINLVPGENTLPGKGHADLIWSRPGRFKNGWFPCIREIAEPYSPWDGSTAGSSSTAIVL